MKKKRISIVAMLLIAGLIAFMIFHRNGAEGSQTQSATRQRILPVDVYVLKPQGVTDVYPVVSRLIPSEDVDLSFETSGRITEILFDEGTFVEKGKLLAKVNDARLQAQLKKLKAQLTLYESKEFRQKALLAKDAISQQTYDESNTAVETTLADIELLKAQIRETELRAPFDGFIGLRKVSEGAYATPTTIVAKLTKISPLKMELSVPEKFIDMVKPGTKITFRIDDDTTLYKASVYASESESSDLHMFTVRAYYPNLKHEISPGHYASISLHLNYSEDGLSVPAEAVIAEVGEQVVYKLQAGKARRTVIQPGLRTASMVQVLGGLNLGDTVLTTGILQLREGIDVKVIDVR
jgi:membrane fusion protein (multidrug efflux system)